MIKIASWNVNSLKIRMDQVLNWLIVNNVDVMALQETKMTDDNFPKQVFHDLGYHVLFCGQKSYNGVAVISRLPQEDVIMEIPGLNDPQRRILGITIGGLRIINIYVPNGAAVNSEKFAYKMSWLKQLIGYLEQQLQQYSKLTVLGDFNIAPEDIDVHDPKIWEGCVMVSAEEREAFRALLGLGLKDSFRLFPENGQEYSWWDYRAGSFRRNNGLRIDHILLSEDLALRCHRAQIDRPVRKHERPSDHAPVWVELDL